MLLTFPVLPSWLSPSLTGFSVQPILNDTCYPCFAVDPSPGSNPSWDHWQVNVHAPVQPWLHRSSLFLSQLPALVSVIQCKICTYAKNNFINYCIKTPKLLVKHRNFTLPKINFYVSLHYKILTLKAWLLPRHFTKKLYKSLISFILDPNVHVSHHRLC